MALSQLFLSFAHVLSAALLVCACHLKKYTSSHYIFFNVEVTEHLSQKEGEGRENKVLENKVETD